MALNRAMPEVATKVLPGTMPGTMAAGRVPAGSTDKMVPKRSSGDHAPVLEAASSTQRARWTLGEMTGRSAAMERLFLQMRYLSRHLRLALIEGERGTGKRLVAQTLHRLKGYAEGSFVDCPADRFFSGEGFAEKLKQAHGGTLYLSRVDTLNHEQQGRLLHLLGWLQQQVPGASLPLPGSGKPHLVSGNVSSAVGGRGLDEPSASVPRVLLLSSDRAIRPLMLYGKFRSDLHQQLSAVQLVLPPLRERREDIAMLVRAMLAKFEKQYGKGIHGTAEDVLPCLLTYAWPGNVAELEAVVFRAALRADQGWLQRKDVLLPAHASELGFRQDARPVSGVAPEMKVGGIRQPGTAAPQSSSASSMRHETAAARHAIAPERTSPSAKRTWGPGESSRFSFAPAAMPGAETASFAGESLDPSLDRAIARHIRRVLASVDGNKLRAARLLGISRSTLYRMLDASGPVKTSGADQALERAEL